MFWRLQGIWQYLRGDMRWHDVKRVEYPPTPPFEAHRIESGAHRQLPCPPSGRRKLPQGKSTFWRVIVAAGGYHFLLFQVF